MRLEGYVNEFCGIRQICKIGLEGQAKVGPYDVKAIYHITYLRNLPSVLEHNGLYCDNERLRALRQRGIGVESGSAED